MNPLAKATFLRIGGALYDGSDEGRWFSLPARKHTVPVQYMRAPEAPAEVRRDGALSGRQDVDHADGA